MAESKTATRTIIFPVIVDLENPTLEILTAFKAVIDFYASKKVPLNIIGDAIACAEILTVGMIDDKENEREDGRNE